MFQRFRKLLSSSSGITAKPSDDEWDPRLFIYLMIPGDIQPLDRGSRFEDPLAEKLQQSQLGSISGGGSQLDDPYPDGRQRVEFCGIDIDVIDLDAARAMLMTELIALAAPVGTELHYTKGVTMLLDRLTDDGWQQGAARTMKHPGFGV